MSHGLELIFHKDEQGSDEWLQSRVGMITGTDAECLWVEPSKKAKDAGQEWGTGAITLARKIVAEKLTGQSQDLTLKWSEALSEFYLDNFENGYTKWGHVHEAKSKELINNQFCVNFESVNFVSIKDRIIGCSPDGLCINNGVRKVLEMKHPNSQKVISYIDDIELLFDEHGKQLIHEAYVLDADEAWLAARDPRLPAPLDDLIVHFVLKGEELKTMVSQYEEKLRRFVYFVKKLEDKILSLA